MYTQTCCCRLPVAFIICMLLFVFSVPPVEAQADTSLFLPLVQVVKAPIASTVVTTQEDELNNDGDCSLREAIHATNTDRTVDNCLADDSTHLLLLPAGMYTLTLAGAHEENNFTGDLDITGTLTISGVGAGSPIINGNQIDRVLQVVANSNVTLNHITVYNGKTPDGADSTTGRGEDSEHGGGIANDGALTLIASTVISNSTGKGGAGQTGAPGTGLGGDSGNGGALYNSGTLTVSNGEILNNWTGNGGANGVGACIGASGSQGGSGGGIYNAEGGAVVLFDSTVGNNYTGYGSNCRYLPGEGGGNGADGAGMANFGSMTLENSTISNNQTAKGQDALGNIHSRGGNAGRGGGIFNQNGLRLRNSTLSRNRTGDGGQGLANGSGDGGNGGGIANWGLLILENVTLSQNATGAGGFGGYGGGIYSENAVALNNTLIGGNSAAQSGPDCTGLLKAYGFNLIQDVSNCAITQRTYGNMISQNPLLAPLADNGGATWTHALQSGSAALDVSLCLNIDGSILNRDQRGVARPQGTNCDLGAYELQR